MEEMDLIPISQPKTRDFTLSVGSARPMQEVKAAKLPLKECLPTSIV